MTNLQKRLTTLTEQFTSSLLSIIREEVRADLEMRIQAKFSKSETRRSPGRVTLSKTAADTEVILLEREELILKTISNLNNRATSSEIAYEIGIGETTARTSLKNLFAGGLVSRLSEGKKVYYCIQN